MPAAKKTPSKAKKTPASQTDAAAYKALLVKAKRFDLLVAKIQAVHVDEGWMNEDGSEEVGILEREWSKLVDVTRGDVTGIHLSDIQVTMFADQIRQILSRQEARPVSVKLNLTCIMLALRGSSLWDDRDFYADTGFERYLDAIEVAVKADRSFDPQHINLSSEEIDRVLLHELQQIGSLEAANELAGVIMAALHRYATKKASK